MKKKTIKWMIAYSTIWWIFVLSVFYFVLNTQNQGNDNDLEQYNLTEEQKKIFEKHNQKIIDNPMVYAGFFTMVVLFYCLGTLILYMWDKKN